ncbi:LysR family transcriptional regulator [Zhongshania aliphaticivorans]|uniref:LysR family transcriptional regulator n=1 Tax=Zhongshania aliphaticivorans TaxID=1470434 RepID=UPI0012E5C1A5|nr:LysR family transcriptional regulator [Zhongshania aliphaticivorans]CAA0102062.1 HTH-type transcriptional activator CmpR [Zhongshania aliphaticivorans]
MNSSKLRYIVAVDRFGSMTAAATAIHVSQPSLTRTVAEVEKELGIALFERRARGMVATAQGRSIIDRAARILADIERLDMDAKEFRAYRESHLRLCISPPPLITLMNPALPQLLSHHPQLKVDIKSLATDNAISLLRAGDCDLIIGPTQALEEKREFKIIPLKPFDAYFFTRRSHPLTKKRAVSKQHILNYPLVLPERDGASPEITSRLFGDTEIPADHPIHIIGHFPLACEVVAATDAVATVGQTYLNNKEFLKRFTILDFTSADKLSVCCAHRQEFELSAPATALVKLLAQ